MRWSGSAIFAILVAFFLLLMVIGAREFTSGAWIYPVVIGIPTFILALVQFTREVQGGSKKEERVYDVAPERSVSANLAYKRAAQFFGWILGLYLAIWLLGFKIAFLLFFVLFIKLEGRKGWLITLVLSALFVLTIIILYGRVFGVHWPEGLLESYIKIPF